MTEVPIPKEPWKGGIGELTIGDRTIGGAKGMPMLPFEDGTVNRPMVAGEVLDRTDELHTLAREGFGDAVDDPVEWARAWVGAGAGAVCLRLISTDPEGDCAPAEDAVRTVRAVADAIDVPLIVYGCGNPERDAEVLKAVAENVDRKLILGHAEEDSYKTLAAVATANGHVLIAFSNLDINLAKQMNILLRDFGTDLGTVIMDPLMAALGMGLEYSYSVNERIRLAALSGDRMLQVPMLCDAVPAWQVREATDDDPSLGDPAERVAWWEATTAISAIVSGADVVIVRGARAAGIVNGAIDDLMGVV